MGTIAPSHSASTLASCASTEYAVAALGAHSVATTIAPAMNLSGTRLVRAFLRRVSVQQREKFGGGLGRAHAIHDDITVLQLLAVQRGVVVQILTQRRTFE